MNIKILFATSLVAFPMVGNHVQASTYPQRTISLTVPYGAGGASDGIARKFATLLEAKLKQPVIIVNQPGASGTLQLGHLSRAKPDGYTIGFYSYSNATFTSQIMKVPYTRSDFELLGGIAEFSYGIVTYADSTINTIDDLLARGKSPKGIFYGVTGAPNNFPFLHFQKLTGGDFEQVTYRSSAESVNAVIGKHVDVALQTPSEYAELVKSGKLKLIASASNFRLPWFPDVPTIKEQGYDISISGVLGIAAPAGIPAEAKATLENAIYAVVTSDEYTRFLVDEYGIKNYPATSKEYSALIDTGLIAMRKMIETYNLQQ